MVTGADMRSVADLETVRNLDKLITRKMPCPVTPSGAPVTVAAAAQVWAVLKVQARWRSKLVRKQLMADRSGRTDIMPSSSAALLLSGGATRAEMKSPSKSSLKLEAVESSDKCPAGSDAEPGNGTALANDESAAPVKSIMSDLAAASANGSAESPANYPDLLSSGHPDFAPRPAEAAQPQEVAVNGNEGVNCVEGCSWPLWPSNKRPPMEPITATSISELPQLVSPSGSEGWRPSKPSWIGTVVCNYDEFQRTAVCWNEDEPPVGVDRPSAEALGLPAITTFDDVAEFEEA
eukprot:gnl/TRDRNA2_/TRDRNA2_161438_c0_seq2.p1 gnl/TRDRNA2_/TRDRNA2_161438_c0~~gnl/TRDRNA2_/TRDRNA2_161438_c0_seq2.p1  ORF type:complete len:333 (+),score=53.08 gnl/TRDRNA2_/TRDRNA2_161438_c0_seq2:125-1000(+)